MQQVIKGKRRLKIMVEMKLYTIDEVANILKISKATVYRLFRTGALNWHWVGSQRRVTQDHLDEFLKKGVDDVQIQND